MPVSFYDMSESPGIFECNFFLFSQLHSFLQLVGNVQVNAVRCTCVIAVNIVDESR